MTVMATIEFRRTSLVISLYQEHAAFRGPAAPTATLEVRNYDSLEREIPWWYALFARKAYIAGFCYRGSRRLDGESLGAFLDDLKRAMDARQVYWAYALELRRDYPRWGHLEILGVLGLLR